MTKCKECEYNYPDEILSEGICGICALELINKTHNTNFTELNGTMAEYFRQEAIKHRKLTWSKKNE